MIFRERNLTTLNDNYKTKKMVKQVVQVEYVLVNNEYEALLLENNLIKSYQPKYKNHSSD